MQAGTHTFNINWQTIKMFLRIHNVFEFLIGPQTSYLTQSLDVSLKMSMIGTGGMSTVLVFSYRFRQFTLTMFTFPKHFTQ